MSGNLYEFVSDYVATIESRVAGGPTAREIAEAYLDQYGDPSKDFEAQVLELIPSVRYYLS